jgi:hypothetical protein
LLQEEVAAPYVRLLALLVRRNQATIGGERVLFYPCCCCSCDALHVPAHSCHCLPACLLALLCSAFANLALANLCCSKFPLPADYMQEMRLSLEHLALLPPNAALSLLLAVWPMCRCGLALPAKLLLPLSAVCPSSIYCGPCVWQQHTG